jgi:hypothetical protein
VRILCIGGFNHVVRAKNRIKSMYRSRGVAVAGKSVYRSAGREPWQAQLPEACRGLGIRTIGACRWV